MSTPNARSIPLAKRLSLPVAAVGVVLLLAAMPTLQRSVGFPLYNLIFLYMAFFWTIQATSWNILSGYSGYFSFGQTAFYGAGIYATAILGSRYGWALMSILPVAGLIGATIAALVGLLVFRLRKLSGEVFGLFTLAVALGIGAIINNLRFLDGGRGIVVRGLEYPGWLPARSDTEVLYYLGLMLVVIVLIIAYAIQHSRFGAGLFAIQDDEKVAESIGVPTFRYKMAIFVISGTIAAVGGALHAVQVYFVSPAEVFTLQVPVFVILMSMVGGRRQWFGPLLGALLIHTISDRMAGAGFAEASQIALAIVLVVATLFLRTGIAGRLVERSFLPTMTFVVVTLFSAVVRGMPAITAVAYGMVATMLVLFMSDGLLRRIGIGRRSGESTEVIG
jgi:branched-chain amino acid transport system permease protein